MGKERAPNAQRIDKTAIGRAAICVKYEHYPPLPALPTWSEFKEEVEVLRRKPSLLEKYLIRIEQKLDESRNLEEFLDNPESSGRDLIRAGLELEWDRIKEEDDKRTGVRSSDIVSRTEAIRDALVARLMNPDEMKYGNTPIEEKLADATRLAKSFGTTGAFMDWAGNVILLSGNSARSVLERTGCLVKQKGGKTGGGLGPTISSVLDFQA